MRIWLILLLVAIFCIRPTPLYASDHDDGHRIAFVMTTENASRIMTVDQDEQNLQQVAECLNPCRDPVWSASGHQLGFVDGNALVTVEISTGQLDRFPVDLGTYDYNVTPSWTPDLSRVIHAARVNMGGVLRLTDLLRHTTFDIENTPDAPFFPTWIDNGKGFLFAASGKIYYYDMKQRHITRLTPADQRFDLPIPSPDNQQILIRRIDDGDQALALLDRETGDITTILKGIVDNPRWSPDGQVIALNHWEDGTVSLITVSLTTDKQVVVAENPVLDYAPTWSPDGKQIAYIGIDSDQPQYNTLYVVDASGKSSSQRIVERISRAGSPSSGLSWQPDGDKP